jgi:glutamate/tyrosine decarboxylase-like PLP-dependent enzyme
MADPMGESTNRSVGPNAERSLDPDDWDEARGIFHEAVDLAIDHLRGQRDGPVWRATPEAVKQHLAVPAPAAPQALDALVAEFRRDILPYGTGNVHPRFFGWVHGAGTLAGALGEMLAGVMNCNVGGRDHVAVYVERQVVAWCKAIFGFPAASSGLLTSGTSMGTVIALAVARNAKADAEVQRDGIAAAPRPIVAYASREVHGANEKAFDLLGLGTKALRRVAVDAHFRIRVDELARQIAADRAQGLAPAIVIASAGTVNTGAIDDLDALVALCRAEGLWLHVDAAFGGLAILVPEFRTRLAAIAQADSVAFDFHKWLQVPYDAGCVLVRDEAAHRRSFSSRGEYLAEGAALAGGDPWFCEYGPELSRGFRALKVWFTVKAYGIDRLAGVIAQNIRQARHLGAAVAATPELELLAPVDLNIVCFRFRAPGLSDAAQDRLASEIVAALQTAGTAAPSTTHIGGRNAIRVCLTNHRTTTADLDVFLREAVRLGHALSAQGDRLRVAE